jgi:predicted naringenin-chalcone synthase
MNKHLSAAAPAILALGTAVPQYQLQQATLSEWMAESFADQPSIARLIRAVHAQSGIATRHSCIPDYGQTAQASRYALGGDLGGSASTAERMALYERESVPLALAAAEAALAQLARERQLSPAALAAQITHLVAVSCTGFFAPGLDFALTKQLPLQPTVDRQLIGFMGCAAAFNGLRSAVQAVRSEPGALALVVCVELASLHSYPDSSRDTLVAASLFADGAGAALVGYPTADDRRYFTLDGFHSSIKPETEEEMAWQIGNHGFTLRLSPRVPAHLAEIAPTALARLFDHDAPCFWAIHPGGRAIVERLADIFALTPAQTAATFAVLRDYGNMSSATILFVLHELQRQWQAAASHADGPSAPPRQGVAMAFGPGLVIEMARLTYIDGPRGRANGLVNGLPTTERQPQWVH